jgi:DNA-binding beta-propeller fold protein YncE
VRPRQWLAGPLVLLTLGVAGCAGRQAASRSEPEVMAWPAPPQPPRVTFVQILASQRSMGQEGRGIKGSVVDFFAGKQPPRDHLYQPMDIDVSDDGQRVYIADFGQMAVYVADFASHTLAPLPQNFEHPFGIAIDAQENIYVSEQDARRITVLDSLHRTVRVISDTSLVRPAGLAIDRARGLLYVADPSRQGSPDHSVKVFDLTGKLVKTVGAGRGNCDGCLLFPTFVAVDTLGRIFVSNTLNGRVEVFDADGRFLKRIGERGNAFGMFDKPKGIALDTAGNIYVVDSGWSNVQIFSEKGEVLLYFGGRGEYPGLLANPTGITIDKRNRIYVADFLNNRVAAYQLVDAATDSVTAAPHIKTVGP